MYSSLARFYGRDPAFLTGMAKLRARLIIAVLIQLTFMGLANAAVKSAYAGYLGMSQVHGFREFSKDQTVTNAELSYLVSPSISVGGALEYGYTWNQYEDRNPSQLESLSAIATGTRHLDARSSLENNM